MCKLFIKFTMFLMPLFIIIAIAISNSDKQFDFRLWIQYFVDNIAMPENTFEWFLDALASFTNNLDNLFVVDDLLSVMRNLFFLFVDSFRMLFGILAGLVRFLIRIFQSSSAIYNWLTYNI